MSDWAPEGEITLENGQLIVRHREKGVMGRFFVGPQGLVYEGELTLYQKADPPALRFASNGFENEGGRGALGKISFNFLRSDGIQEEVVFLKGTLAEDVEPGELRGQFETRIRASNNAEDMQIGWINTTAYSTERWGERRLYTGSRNQIEGLWKFE